MTIYALLPCAGIGARAGAAGPKQYAPVAGRPLVAHTLAALSAVPRIAATLVVLAPDDAIFETLIAPQAHLWLARDGGATRAATVRAGLRALRERGARGDDWVLVHDAARCGIAPALVDGLLDACLDDPVGGLLALPLADTLKQSGADGRAASTVDRAGKWAAQTPQMFRLALLERALDAAGPGVTDESSAVEALGLSPRLVEGSVENLKVTWPADFALAERLLAARTLEHRTMRIGEGWDTHALVTGRPLVLGGIVVPHSHGLLGHSDADALLHAITDALLGGAGLGDIGRHFPDTDPTFAGADSALLLQEAARRVRAAGWVPVNIDSTIVAQAPKMAPHISAMRERIAALLGLPVDAVNVKAKTAEKMGPVGEGRAIETRAVCLLVAGPPQTGGS
jgi:2-C-methyl-D-erythritol 4-phosphate cytidylyltransferase / 2-C-methyl-D-erythritol 2,4-cyclodiphosphate synthase